MEGKGKGREMGGKWEEKGRSGRRRMEEGEKVGGNGGKGEEMEGKGENERKRGEMGGKWEEVGEKMGRKRGGKG